MEVKVLSIVQGEGCVRHQRLSFHVAGRHSPSGLTLVTLTRSPCSAGGRGPSHLILHRLGP